MKTIIGIGSSNMVSMIEPAENNLEKKFKNPNEVALNRVGKS